MTAIVVRGLDPQVKDALAAQAREHGRSMEAEAREILTRATRRPNMAMALRAIALAHGGLDDLVIPERDDVARSVDFG